MRSNNRLMLALLGGLLTLSGCAEDTTRVGASLHEFAIELSQQTALEGWVTFEVVNNGTEVHEFLLVRTDLPEDMLPTLSDGSYAENGPGTVLLDEEEDIPPGGQVDLTEHLDVGRYVVMCNRVEVEDDGTVVSHYEEGMHHSFEVVQG